MCVCVCAFSRVCVRVCLHDRTFISLPACSALVTVRCLEGGPTARTKPTPAAAAAALSCLSLQSGVCVCVCERERERDSRLKTANILQIVWPSVKIQEWKQRPRLARCVEVRKYAGLELLPHVRYFHSSYTHSSITFCAYKQVKNHECLWRETVWKCALSPPFDGLLRLTPIYDNQLFALPVSVAISNSSKHFCLETWLDSTLYELVHFRHSLYCDFCQPTEDYRIHSTSSISLFFGPSVGWSLFQPSLVAKQSTPWTGSQSNDTQTGTFTVTIPTDCERNLEHMKKKVTFSLWGGR